MKRNLTLPFLTLVSILLVGCGSESDSNPNPVPAVTSPCELNAGITGSLTQELTYTAREGCGGSYRDELFASSFGDGRSQIQVTIIADGVPAGEKIANRPVSIRISHPDGRTWKSAGGNCHFDVTLNEKSVRGKETWYQIAGNGSCKTPIESETPGMESITIQNFSLKFLALKI